MVQYRKSKKFGPFRITASGSGISYSVGSGPMRVTRRADGRVQRTVSIPGTGIRDTRIVGGSQRRAPAASAQPDIAAQLLKLALLSLVLFVFGGFILSVVTTSVAVGFGVVGGLLLAAWAGLGGYVVTLIVRRHKMGK